MCNFCFGRRGSIKMQIGAGTVCRWGKTPAKKKEKTHFYPLIWNLQCFSAKCYLLSWLFRHCRENGVADMLGNVTRISTYNRSMLELSRKLHSGLVKISNEMTFPWGDFSPRYENAHLFLYFALTLHCLPWQPDVRNHGGYMAFGSCPWAGKGKGFPPDGMV